MTVKDVKDNKEGDPVHMEDVPMADATAPPAEPETVKVITTTTTTTSTTTAGAAPIMVEVDAPTTMAAGSTFDAVYNGQTFRVVVPAGGITAGQKLTVPFEPKSGGNTLNRKPVGRWEDDLCDCCRLGPCHPSLCCACWCQPCAMAQVLTRVKFDWCGMPAKGEEWRNTFRNIFIISVIYYVVNSILDGLDPDNEDAVISFIKFVLDIVWIVYIVRVMIRLRFHVRNMYSIPEGECCSGCNDCCCSFWCTCCTTAQMARQTADYEGDEPAACCNSTGILGTV